MGVGSSCYIEISYIYTSGGQGSGERGEEGGERMNVHNDFLDRPHLGDRGREGKGKFNTPHCKK